MDSSRVSSSLKKCEHCAKWTDGAKAFCGNCGEMLDMQYRKEQHEWEESQKSSGPLMPRVKFKNAGNNPVLFALEKLLQGGQMILVALIAFVTAILLLMPA